MQSGTGANSQSGADQLNRQQLEQLGTPPISFWPDFPRHRNCPIRHVKRPLVIVAIETEPRIRPGRFPQVMRRAQAIPFQVMQRP